VPLALVRAGGGVPVLSSVLSRARRVWRDKIAGPTLRTYDAACEELGGEPWRPLPEATDRWFLADRPISVITCAQAAQRPPTLETGAFDLRPRMSAATRLALGAVVALVVIAISVAAVVDRSPRVGAAPLVPLPQVAAPVVTAPAVSAPSVSARSAAPAPPVAAAPPASIVSVTRHFAHRRRR
jgi:hypothetical protein